MSFLCHTTDKNSFEIIERFPTTPRKMFFNFLFVFLVCEIAKIFTYFLIRSSATHLKSHVNRKQ